MSSKNRIIITGVHHTPAKELIDQLINDPSTNWDIYYISHQHQTETHLENSIIPLLQPNHFFSINTGKFDRNSIVKTIFGIPKTIWSIIKAITIVKDINPHITISFGGYASVPVVIATWLLGKTVISHEQTLIFGLATKINHLFSTKVATSFPSNTTKSPKLVYTGNLLRSEIYINRTKSFKHIHKPFIYVTGGSQGSEFINHIINQVLPLISSKFTVIHQTGKKTTTMTRSARYIPQEYIGIDDIGYILNQASIIISRSGANICQEIVVLAKKSILIPLPNSQQGEQLLNAKWVKKQLPKTTIILDQLTTTPDMVLKSIAKLSAIKTKRSKVIRSQNTKLLSLIHELV